jgi:hypothetical protein
LNSQKNDKKKNGNPRDPFSMMGGFGFSNMGGFDDDDFFNGGGGFSSFQSSSSFGSGGNSGGYSKSISTSTVIKYK